MNKGWAFLLLPVVVFADELPKELVMPTDVGKVAITTEDCPKQDNHKFPFKAYATEWKDGMQIIHKGCWSKSSDIVYIWFYDEEPGLIASYKDYHFKPEKNL